MELKLDLARIPALVRREREMELGKAKEKANAVAYSKACKAKEIKYYIALVLVLLGIGLVGTMELNATPEMAKANKKKEIANQYPTTGIVTTVGEGFMVFTDFNGNEWTINGDPEDWVCGDIVSAIMNSKGTDIIYDDEVVSTKYSGWIY